MMRNLLENTRRPDITFNRSGRIFITARVARILDTNPGDTINVAVVGEEYMLFSQHKSIGRHTAMCYPTKKGSLNFCANSAELARAMLDAIQFTGDRVMFMVGKEVTMNGMVYCPIITRAPIIPIKTITT